jgi:hypothetical protein
MVIGHRQSTLVAMRDVLARHTVGSIRAKKKETPTATAETKKRKPTRSLLY